MEELLRFVVLRSPEELSESEQDHIELLDPAAEESRARIDELRALEAADGNAPVLDGSLERKFRGLERYVRSPNANEQVIAELVIGLFEVEDPTELDEWVKLDQDLRHSILRGKFLAGEDRTRLGVNALLLRTMYAVERFIELKNADGGDVDIDVIEAMRKALRARFVIAAPTNEEEEPGPREIEAYQERKEKALEQARRGIELYDGLETAIEYLERLPSTGFKEVKAELNEDEAAPDKAAPRKRRSLVGAFLDLFLPSTDMTELGPLETAGLRIDKAFVSARMPRAGFEAIEHMEIDVSEQSYEQTVTSLRNAQMRVKHETHALLEPFSVNDASIVFGSNTHTMSMPMRSSNSMHYSVAAPSHYTTMYVNGREKYPQSHHKSGDFRCSPIRPSGFGQLLVIRQNLKCYVRSELSHVENVMQGETRTRDHRKAVTTEETFLFEQINERTEERHLETTDRFEMSSEVERVSKTEVQAKGELNVSGKYGPTVEFEASAGVQVTTSKEQAIKVAQEFSQESTEKAVNIISERVREQRTRRIVEELEERNHHGFKNESEGHIIGTYQWLDKIYEAQIWDYGLRQLFDFIVPEPAAFMIAAFQASQTKSQARIMKPAPFTLAPDQLTLNNYHDYVAEYGAKDVQAPPELIETVSKSFSRGSGGGGTRHAESAELTIPDGYEAVHGYMTGTAGGGGDKAIEIHLDRYFYRATTTSLAKSTPMNNQQGSIPVGFIAFKTSVAQATIEVRCRRTEAALEQWKLETHEKIQTAYQQRLSEYHAEQDKLALETAETLKGGNPTDNKRLAETELKRAAMSIIVNQRILIDLMDVDGDDIPYIDFPARTMVDPIIRFLEQAFEWENMNYLYYPYVWSRKEPQWKEKILFQDVDSAFADFVRAGAARVQLAVRPGFEDAVDHFLKTCEPWLGGELPTITDPLYLPFADELAAQLGRPGDEVKVGEPWDVRVPTNLVILRPGTQGDLPKWEEQEDGTWVERPASIDDDPVNEDPVVVDDGDDDDAPQ